MSRKTLERNLYAESEAYGYTLSVWGSGALIISVLGLPAPLGVFAYVTGAVVGFGVLAAVAFDDLLVDHSPDDGSLVVASAVHIVATLGVLVGAYATVELLAPHVSEAVVFAFVGFAATVVYNLLLLLETGLVKRVK